MNRKKLVLKIDFLIGGIAKSMPFEILFLNVGTMSKHAKNVSESTFLTQTKKHYKDPTYYT